MVRIDDRTQVPLGIVASLFSVGIGISIAATFWVSRVNERLSRIEEMLRIAQVAPSTTLETAWTVRASEPGPRSQRKGE